MTCEVRFTSSWNLNFKVFEETKYSLDPHLNAENLVFHTVIMHGLN